MEGTGFSWRWRSPSPGRRFIGNVKVCTNEARALHYKGLNSFGEILLQGSPL